MAKHTTEENQELIDTIKRPIRYYRVTLWGYGGESAYLELTKEQYEFWKAKDEEEYDTTLNYMVDCEDNGKPDWVPEEMDFMAHKDGDDELFYTNWYEAPTEFSHQWGVDIGSARITVTEVEDAEYNSKPLEDVVDGEELQEYLNKIDEENNYELELINMGVAEGTDEQPDYVLQFYSAEKGTFFDGIFESRGPFNIKKLKVFTEEYANGEDIVTDLQYDGESIENMGGDTSGKGYSIHMWSNVNE
jgi:hypothetical protein